MRPKTPKAISKINFGRNPLNSQNLNKKKEDVLYRIANKLENIVSDFNSKSDINKVIKQLKSIVLNIYKFIDEKNSQKEIL